jgi:hypothetical protein
MNTNAHWFALAGPGLPKPQEIIPFDIPAGCGIEVIHNVTIGKPRDTFYEFFGGKSYNRGPGFDENRTIPGAYSFN